MYRCVSRIGKYQCYPQILFCRPKKPWFSTSSVYFDLMWETKTGSHFCIWEVLVNGASTNKGANYPRLWHQDLMQVGIFLRKNYNQILIVTKQLALYIYIYIYIYIYFCIKNAINTNCLGIDDPFLLNKKDLQGVISNI